MENEGAVEIAVVRSNGEGKVSIKYATADNSASAGDDYVETKGTLTFEEGVMRMRISVPIIDDDGRTTLNDAASLPGYVPLGHVATPALPHLVP
jgi:hypothetical protein